MSSSIGMPLSPELREFLQGMEHRIVSRVAAVQTQQPQAQFDDKRFLEALIDRLMPALVPALVSALQQKLHGSRTRSKPKQPVWREPPTCDGSDDEDEVTERVLPLHSPTEYERPTRRTAIAQVGRQTRRIRELQIEDSGTKTPGSPSTPTCKASEKYWDTLNKAIVTMPKTRSGHLHFYAQYTTLPAPTYDTDDEETVDESDLWTPKSGASSVTPNPRVANSSAASRTPSTRRTEMSSSPSPIETSMLSASYEEAVVSALSPAPHAPVEESARHSPAENISKEEGSLQAPLDSLSSSTSTSAVSTVSTELDQSEGASEDKVGHDYVQDDQNEKPSKSVELSEEAPAKPDKDTPQTASIAPPSPPNTLLSTFPSTLQNTLPKIHPSTPSTTRVSQVSNASALVTTDLGSDSMDDIQITGPAAKPFGKNEDVPNAPHEQHMHSSRSLNPPLNKAASISVAPLFLSLSDRFSLPSSTGTNTSPSTGLISSTSSYTLPIFPSSGMSDALSFKQESRSSPVPQLSQSQNKGRQLHAGKARILLREFPDLLTLLREVLPRIEQERSHNGIRGEICDAIRNASSASEIADYIEFALSMEKQHRLMTGAQCIKLEAYARDAQKNASKAKEISTNATTIQKGPSSSMPTQYSFNSPSYQELSTTIVSSTALQAKTDRFAGFTASTQQTIVTESNFSSPKSVPDAAVRSQDNDPKIEQQSVNHATLNNTSPPAEDTKMREFLASTGDAAESLSAEDQLLNLVSQGMQRLSSSLFAYVFHMDLQDPSVRAKVFAYLVQERRWAKDPSISGVETALSKVEEALKDDCPFHLEAIIYQCAGVVTRHRIECKNPRSSTKNIRPRKEQTEILFKRIARNNLTVMGRMKVPKPMSWREIKEKAEAADKDAFQFSCTMNENMKMYGARMKEWVDRWSKVEYVEQHIVAQSRKSDGLNEEEEVAMDVDLHRIPKRKQKDSDEGAPSLAKEVSPKRRRE